MKDIIIALDGHSACGKSTLAKALARALKYVYIDSGAMYRAVTFYAMEEGLIVEGEPIDSTLIVDHLSNINISFNYNSRTGKSETYLNGNNVEEIIRTIEVSRNVSEVSKIKEVREKLVEFQQRLGRNKAIVMDGRDIGTAVFPAAKLKLWITANNEIRVARRYKELLEKGYQVSLKDVEENVAQRDFEDSNRKESPLVKAEDAVVLDNSHLSKEETLRRALELAYEAMKK
ncbi:MAG: (d)CMP kinase [Flavobacteriales bacterium]|jgi:cytidylate kinase|nr:(d)CMP kinase [Flavobacteriales bacterium]